METEALELESLMTMLSALMLESEDSTMTMETTTLELMESSMLQKSLD